MYQIALCDDETTELHMIEQMLHSYRGHSIKDTLSVRSFESADTLLFAIEEESYAPDLIFLDIYMPTLSGLEAAKKLGEMEFPCLIIFLTFSKDHALEAFELNVFHYLVKPVSEETLFSALDRALARSKKNTARYLLFQTEGRIHRVNADDIIYCEAQRKRQCVYLKNGEQLILHMSMTRLYEMLATPPPEIYEAGHILYRKSETYRPTGHGDAAAYQRQGNLSAAGLLQASVRPVL